MKQILLNKKHKNVINGVWNQPKKLIPNDLLFNDVDLATLYFNERDSNETIRLNVTVNTICSNILFNMNTEVIENEGSDSAVCLNFTNKIEQNDFVHKKKTEYLVNNNDKRMYNILDDTQLSRHENITYHCGLDIFNNHILRNTSFKCVNYMPNNKSSVNFNTLKDEHRSYGGNSRSEELYDMDSIIDFDESVKTNLIEDSGWFGFINKSNIPIYDENEKLLEISKTINNRSACEFIDMYPSRDLYSFVPKYNPYRNRDEKNWNYCLTYPSSSTTEGIEFIDSNVNCGALRIYKINPFDERNTLLYCMTKHGLKVGDCINLYKESTVVSSQIIVEKIIDDYTFSIDSTNCNLTFEWVTAIGDSSDATTSFPVMNDGVYYKDTNSNCMSYSFKRLDNTVECQYYVRIFSKLPNFKFAETEYTEDKIYIEKADIMPFQKYESEHSNFCSKLSFAKNIYGDDLAEIVYSDDIDFSMLRTNLGTPITSLYLTIIKNNKGYKEWYANKNKITSSSTIEYSHCFGKVSCGFELSIDDNFKVNSTDTVLSNSLLIHNIEDESKSYGGLLVNKINNSSENTDEIDYYNNINFYGDLCEFSPYSYMERTIENVDYRFNTAQREDTNFNTVQYKNAPFSTNDINKIEFGVFSEGYIYNPHYEIQIKAFSEDLETDYPNSYSIRKITSGSIFTNENNYMQKDDEFNIYDKRTFDTYKCKVKYVKGYREFEYEFVEDIEKEIIDAILQNKTSYKIIKIKNDMPYYSYLLRDGSCRYVWRDIIKDTEKYPFVNGKLYVNKNINLYLKRQNYKYNDLLINPKYSDFEVKSSTITKNNKFYQEKDMSC